MHEQVTVDLDLARESTTYVPVHICRNSYVPSMVESRSSRV